jgi:hypothetical protein
MLEASLVFGGSIFLGWFLIFIKLSARARATLLSYPVALDVGATALTLWMHWGTMTGLMSATIAGLITSVAISVARPLFGYFEQGTFHPGLFVKREPV